MYVYRYIHMRRAEAGARLPRAAGRAHRRGGGGLP